MGLILLFFGEPDNPVQRQPDWCWPAVWRAHMPNHRRASWVLGLGLTFVAVALSACRNQSAPSTATAAELPVVDLAGGPAFPLPAHLEETDLAAGTMTFEQIFEAGGDLFHTSFNEEDGVGALRLPDGSPIRRFTPYPPGGGAPLAIASQSCGRCHVNTASGPAQSTLAADPDGDGKPPFRVRSTTSLFGNGILQLLAQEITEDLQAVRDEAAEAARAQPGERIERDLVAKDMQYGVLAATAGSDGTVTFDMSGLRGIDPDLVLRPLGWKGHVATIRTFTMGAANVGMSMQAEELVWRMNDAGAPADPDGDGVERELSVGDITAMVVYGAAQETPQSLGRLAELGFVAAPTEADRARIERGRAVFDEVGCAGCHKPEMRLMNTVFEEPTLRGNGHYIDTYLTSKNVGYDPERPVRFDVLRDAQEPRAEAHPDGGAIIRLYGDLKRHRMGRQLAETGPQPPVDATGAPLTFDGRPVLIGADEFLTPELWGVGNTGPWMHDGRAASLRTAVLEHGEDDPPQVGSPGRSEAQEARDAFLSRSPADQAALLVFLRSLRTFPVERP
jgi:mono/diheme cytochrome c family protein